jgi:F0F1-type ATP synthase membrane subunit b/b'
MPKFEKLLQEARVKGEPVGAAHYQANHQFKAWVKKATQKATNTTQLVEARTAKKVKGEVRKAVVAVNQARDRIKQAVKNLPRTETELRERKAELDRKKLADGYKSIMGDVSHVKSVGNGL